MPGPTTCQEIFHVQTLTTTGDFAISGKVHISIGQVGRQTGESGKSNSVSKVKVTRSIIVEVGNIEAEEIFIQIITRSHSAVGPGAESLDGTSIAVFNSGVVKISSGSSNGDNSIWLEACKKKEVNT